MFPKGTIGRADRRASPASALWQAGLDFDHGTGHGVGSYLSVHEGPQRIVEDSARTALEPGMILSNEPGYYKAGAIRHPHREPRRSSRGARSPAASAPMLGFETLTFAPIDRALVEPALLTADERDWLDAYHARVREVLTPELDEATRAWLVEATRPLAPTAPERRG